MKKLIYFLLSLIVPIGIIAVVSFSTPASDTLYLYDYLMLFNKKALKGTYLNLVSIDANNEVFTSKFKDSSSVESIPFKDYIALTNGDNFYLIDLNIESIIRIKAKGSVSSAIVVNNTVYFAYQDPKFNGWRSKQVCQLSLSGDTTYDSKDYSCVAKVIEENQTKFSILKEMMSADDLVTVNNDNYLSYLLNDYSSENTLSLVGNNLASVDASQDQLLIYDLNETLIETIDLMVGEYESARIVNPSYHGLIAIEFFNSGEKQLKFYDLNSHEFNDFSYQYGPGNPLICAYVLKNHNKITTHYLGKGYPCLLYWGHV